MIKHIVLALASPYKLAAVVAAVITVGFANAEDTETHSANRIDGAGGDAVMYVHEKALLGLSCRSGPVGKLSGLSEIKIGDTLTQGKHSLAFPQFTRHFS
jgi:hypothetical protein